MSAKTSCAADHARELDKAIAAVLDAQPGFDAGHRAAFFFDVLRVDDSAAQA